MRQVAIHAMREMERQTFRLHAVCLAAMPFPAAACYAEALASQPPLPIVKLMDQLDAMPPVPEASTKSS